MAKILIVEDDEQTAKKLAAELKSAGHACAVRHKGNGVLEALRKGTPDLLVLDVMLPDASGFEICRLIRRDTKLFNLPILIVSAMSDPEEIDHGLSQGADLYLTKPYQPPQLLQHVSTLLQGHGEGELEDGVTGLPNRDGVRRELQKRIGRGDTFGLVYVEVVNLRKFGQRAGPEGRDKAIRHVGRALRLAAGDVSGDSEYFVGHMGSGHFICVLSVDNAQKFSRMVRDIWQKHLDELYGSLGLEHVLSELRAAGGESVVDLQFYVTFRRNMDAHSAQELLDIISRIRNTVGALPGTRIHVDRRA